MQDLNFQAAYEFYQCHIYRTDFFKLLRDHNLKTSGAVPSITWELFGSILTGQRGADGYGADLDGIEIKSAKAGSSFEYQYHLNSGLIKLKEDVEVDHYYCNYSEDYKAVSVYCLAGKNLADDFFKKWIPLYKKNYARKEDSETRRQRFRKSIPYGFVVKNGTCVMKIEGGVMNFPNSPT